MADRRRPLSGAGRAAEARPLARLADRSAAAAMRPDAGAAGVKTIQWTVLRAERPIRKDRAGTARSPRRGTEGSARTEGWADQSAPVQGG